MGETMLLDEAPGVGCEGMGGAAGCGCRLPAADRPRGRRRARADPAHDRRAHQGRRAPDSKAKLTATLTSAGKPVAGKKVAFVAGSNRPRPGHDGLEGPRGPERQAHGAAERRRALHARRLGRRRLRPVRERGDRARARGRVTVAIEQLSARRPQGRRDHATRRCGCAARWRRYVAGGRRRAVGVPRARRVLHETRRVTASQERQRQVRPLDQAVTPRRVPRDGAAARRRRRRHRPALRRAGECARLRRAWHRRARPPAPAQGPWLRDPDQRPLRREHRARRARLPQGERLRAHHDRRPHAFSAGWHAAEAASSCATRRRASTPSSTGRARCSCWPAGSRPQIVLHTSSGAPSTPTVFGKYRFYRKHPGYNAKGMYYSSYFVGGYAIHGFTPCRPSRPATAACAFPSRAPSACTAGSASATRSTRTSSPRRRPQSMRTSSIAIFTIPIARTGRPPGPRGIATRRVGILNPPKSR